MTEAGISERGQRFYRTMEAEVARGDLHFPTCMRLGLQIRRVLEDADSGPVEIARLVGLEPLLAALVVRLANSALYHRHGPAVADVRSALMRVGVNNVKPLALAVIARQIAHSGSPAIQRQAQQLWLHTIEVAALSWAIAIEVESVQPDQALYSGLVHTLGSFYLLARAGEFPELLEDHGELSDLIRYWSPRVSREVLLALGTPASIADAVEDADLYFEGWPPRNLSDVLYIALVSAETPDPFQDLGGVSREALTDEAFGRIRAPELQSMLARAAGRRAEALAVLSA